MATRNTRAKRIAKKNLRHLLVDDIAFKMSVARNLNLLAADILSEEEQSKPDVLGRALLETVDTLPMEEHMVICKYYGLVGPKYQAVSLSAIAKEHHTTMYQIEKLKERGLEILRLPSRKSRFHLRLKKEAEDRLVRPANYVELSFLYPGFRHTNAYRILRIMGIEYISTLATCNLPKLADEIDKQGHEIKYCNLLELAIKAQNFNYTEEILSYVAAEKDGFIITTLDDLMLTEDVLELLKYARVKTLSELLSMTKLQIMIAADGDIIEAEKLFKIRESLNMPVND